ncbi:MAG: VCBS repeat-containing protein [Dysgonamonadaceae bacterium]|nr:VCBS repeat-containing protein [Dysgonamonadaceae bacterium]
MSAVVCKFGTNTLRTYTPAYALQQSVNQMTQLKYSAQGSSLNPLSFYYGTNADAGSLSASQTSLPKNQYYTSTNQGNTVVKTGKFDSYTNDDALAVYPLNEPYYRNVIMGDNFYVNNNSSTDKVYLYSGMKGTVAKGKEITLGAGFIDIIPADIDGLFNDEIVKINNSVITNGAERLDFTVYSKSDDVYTSKNSFYFTFTPLINSSTKTKHVHPKYYYAGDFNGDGKMEIFAVSNMANGAESRCYLFDMNTGTKLFDQHVFDYNRNEMYSDDGDRIFVTDYDGDGKSDICLINSSGTSIYRFNISGATYSMQQVGSTYTDLKLSNIKGRLLPGDFNGDGKLDFMLTPTLPFFNLNKWQAYYSKGNGAFEKVEFEKNISLLSTLGFMCFTQDVTGDGITDIILKSGNGLVVYPVNPYTGQPEAAAYAANIPDDAILSPTDINSYGHFACILALKDGTVKKYEYSLNENIEHCLTGIVGSMGTVGKISYECLDNCGKSQYDSSASIYSSNNVSSFPYVSFNGHLYVPSNTEVYFNGLRTEFITYKYENAVFHRQGLGFRGFSKITSTDNMRNYRQTVQEYDPLNFGLPKKIDSPTGTDTYSYTVSVGSNKIVTTKLNSLTSLDKSRNLTVTTTYGNYDAYGNPGLVTVNYGSGINESESIIYYNNTSESSYLLGFPTDRTTTLTRSGQTWKYRTYCPSHDSKGSAKALFSTIYDGSAQNKFHTRVLIILHRDLSATGKVQSIAVLHF